MMAAGGGHVKAVAILLAAGADVEARDKVRTAQYSTIQYSTV
jgi:hypothetical protein